jgi:Cu+-exporting ATPase
MRVDAIEDRELTVTDPVCGKDLGLDAVAAHENYDGWVYFFCSAACHRKFLANPGRYSVGTGRTAPMDASEHER